MKVRGGKETARNLRTLASFVSVPLNAASRFALQPTVSAARRNVKSLGLKESTGTLASSLTVKRKASPKHSPVHQVGPDSGKRIPGRRPVRYAHLIEFGFLHTSGVLVPPKPFLTPAYLSTRDEVVARFGRRYGPEIEKRAARLGATVRR